jgi:hypothetical protein
MRSLYPTRLVRDVTKKREVMMVAMPTQMKRIDGRKATLRALEKTPSTRLRAGPSHGLRSSRVTVCLYRGSWLGSRRVTALVPAWVTA